MTARNFFPTILAAAVMTVPFSAMASVETPAAAVEMAKKVRRELVMLPFLGVFDNVTFEIHDGTVTLRGAVTRPTLKTSAERVTQSVAGVTSVINKIEVLPVSTFDDSIRLRTLRAVYGAPAMQRYGLGAIAPVRIIVKNGEVTLEGVVLNDMDRNLAFVQANGVSGVFKVTNNLRVEVPAKPKA